MDQVPKLDANFFYQRRRLQDKAPIEAVSFSTQLVLAEAEKLGMTWELIPDSFMFELTFNDKKAYFNDRMPETTSALAVESCRDKHLTKVWLNRAGIACPKGHFITRDDPETYWVEVFNQLQEPVVVKPTNASHGDGITMGVNDEAALIAAVRTAFSVRQHAGGGVEIEEQFTGKEYRVCVTRDQVLGVMHRIPANVEGDGRSTIAQLVEQKNQHPYRNLFGDNEYQVYGKIRLTDDTLEILREQGLTPESVIPAGQKVFVKKVSNMLAGGDALDLTDSVHPTVKEICLQAIKAIPGLALAGVDFMTKDINAPQTPETYTIVEVNHNAEFGIHYFPMVGKPRNTAYAFLRLLYPELPEASE